MFITRLEKETILARLKNLEQAVIRFTLLVQSTEKALNAKVGRPKSLPSNEEVEKRRAYARAYYKGKKAAEKHLNEQPTEHSVVTEEEAK